MSTTTSACQNCAAPLPSASPGGLCPACLMGEAIDSLDTMQEGPSTDRSLRTSPLVPDPLEGTSLGIGGRYKILQRLGEGGFGTVYMAEQSVPVRRRVAVKILKAGMDTRQVVARFEAERQALAMMDHPNIAHVFDGGETEQGRPYFVMELVRGTPLTDFCDREHLNTKARLRLFLQVCRAVQHAHQKGIIHRDLKPGNVLITMPDGAEPVPKVIDFGVAKAMESSLTDKTLFTRFEQMIGTPAYMSPEQAGTEGTHDIDTRADIYALGVLLYELLTGTTPFEAQTLQRAAFEEVRRILREEEAPRPSARLSSLEADRRTTIARDRGTEVNGLGRQLRGDLDWIVMKAIEKDRRRRYETANAFALDVERHLEDQPVSAGPPTVGYRLSKWTKRHARWAAMGAGILLLMTGATAFSLWQASLARDAEARASKNFASLRTAYHELDSANQTAQRARNETRKVLVRTLLEKGTQQFNQGEMVGLITFQEAVSAASGDEELQSLSMELWTLARGWLSGAVHEVFDTPYAVALSPDESLVTWCDASALHFYSVDTGRRTTHQLDGRLLAIEAYERGDHLDLLGLKFSPDGTLLAVHNPEDGAAQVWNVRHEKPVTEVLIHPSAASPLPPPRSYRWIACPVVEFNAAGDRLATLCMNGTVCLWDVQAQTLAVPAWSFLRYPKSVHFSPNGELLAVGIGESAPNDQQPGAFIFDLDRPSDAKVELPVQYRANQLRFINDENLAVLDSDQVHLWEFQTGRVSETPRGFYESLGLTPDGKAVAIGGRSGHAELRSADTFELIGSRLEHGGGGVRAVGFSSDGAMLATGGLNGTIQTWSLGDPHYHIATWPQPGTIDQLLTGSTGSQHFVTKSRTRDNSQPPCAILRSFPEPVARSVASLPDGAVMMDATPDGRTLLIRSADRMRLMVWNREEVTVFDQNSVQPGPALDPPATGITGASFAPDLNSIVFSARMAHQHVIRQWLLAENSIASVSDERSAEPYANNHYVQKVLPGTPSLAVVSGTSWHFNLVDFRRGELFRTIRLANSPAGVAIARDAGWYALGDRSGNLRRFRIDTHEEILPAIRAEGQFHTAACSGDGQWIVTEERDAQTAEFHLRAWKVGVSAPFFNLKLPVAQGEGRGFTAWEAGKVRSRRLSPILPVDKRGFLFQDGSELLRFDLPAVSLRPEQVEAATLAVLAVRKEESGKLRLLGSEEFRQAKARASLQP